MRRLRSAGLILAILSGLVAGVTPAEAAASGQVQGLRTTMVTAYLVVLNWDTVPNADHYEITLGGRTLWESDNTWETVVHAKELQTLEVQVAAVINNVLQPPSESISFDTPAFELRDPEIGGHWVGFNALEIVWPERSGVHGIEIFRDGESVFLGQAQSHYTDRNLTSGTTYRYKARQIGSDGREGPFGPEILLSTSGLQPGQVPRVPDLSSTFVDSSHVVLKMAEPSDGSPAEAKHYEIYRDGELIRTINLRSISANYWHTDTDVDPGTTYRYQVRSVGADGTPSELSQAVEVTTTGTKPKPFDPPPVEGLQEHFGRSEQSLGMRWQPLDQATEYVVYRDGVEYQRVATTEFNDSSLLGGDIGPGETHTYAVAGVFRQGIGPSSSSFEASTLSPGSLGGLDIRRVERRVIVMTWSPRTETTRYQIVRDGIVISEQAGRWFSDRTFSDETTATADLPGSTHTYRIIAFGPDNTVQSTTAITVTTPDGWNVNPSTGTSSTAGSADGDGTTE